MNEWRQRIEKLQARMEHEDIDAFLLTQNVDMYYFTGSMQTGYLWIPRAGEPTYYVKRSLARATEESALQTKDLGSFRSFGGRVAQDYPGLFSSRHPVVASDFDVLPVQVFERLKMVFSDVEWVDGSLWIRELRMVKSAWEIEKLRQAAEVCSRAFEYGMSRLQAGMTEIQLLSEFEYAMRRDGSMGCIRMRGYNQEVITGMVGSGYSIAMPSYFDGPAGGQGLGPANPVSSGRKPIAENEPILIDIGCMVDGYVTDQTRTAVIGKLDPDLEEAYRKAEEILRKTEANLQPGTRCEDLYLSALAIVEEVGLADHFMGYGPDQAKFLGHGIGQEIDEYPVLAKGFKYLLEPGMTIAIEPKFTFPERGVVGIENTYVITPDGFEKLTRTGEGLFRR